MPQEVSSMYDYDKYLARAATELEPLCEQCEDAQATETVRYLLDTEDTKVCGNCYDKIIEAYN